MEDTLYFYSKSADKVPGKGANEHVSDPKKYSELKNISHWRKILSNFYVSPFTFDGYTYNSVEHAFQGIKIGMFNKEKGLWFTIESGHEIGQGDGLIARKNRKLIVLSDSQLREWGMKKNDIMEKILYAKFTQVSLAKQVLLETKDAILLHSTRGPAERQYILEKVRGMIY
jgi:predicted NAD-dependent protein-ADP-ribosyltransferase YbiA (DUF1768 family)